MGIGNDSLLCGNELSTCGNELLTCGYELLTRGHNFLSRGNEIKKGQENSSMSLPRLRIFAIVKTYLHTILNIHNKI